MISRWQKIARLKITDIIAPKLISKNKRNQKLKKRKFIGKIAKYLNGYFIN